MKDAMTSELYNLWKVESGEMRSRKQGDDLWKWKEVDNEIMRLWEDETCDALWII